MYLKGYDGHCLRAYTYFKDEMPDIKQIPEDDSVPCYKANVGGAYVWFTADEEVEYQGQIYTGKQFYEAHCS